MRLKWNDFSGGLWLVGPTEDNPPTTLRRAKGVAPLRTRALRSRSGTLKYFDVAAHSMTRYNGEYILGVGTQLYKSASLAIGSETAIADSTVFDGSRLTFVQMPPTSKALIDGAGVQDYLFIAGGGGSTALYKLNPAHNDTTEWGISPPNIAATTAVVAAQGATTIDDLDLIADATTWVNTDGGYTLQNDATRYIQNSGGGGGSMRLDTITKDSTVHADRLAVTLDLTNNGAGTGTSPLEDYITFSVRINRPKNVKAISIIFDVDTDVALAAFGGKKFSRDLRIEVVRKKRKRRLIGTGDIIKKKDERKFLRDKKTLPRDTSTQEQIAENVVGVTRRRWTRVTLPKRIFEASTGANPDTDWDNVRAIRFEVETNKQGGASVNFDFLQLVGGVGMQGDYQYNFTFLNSSTGTRSNPDLDDADIVTVKDVERQGVTLANVPFSSDGQVDFVEVWRTMGNGEIFFKATQRANTETAPGSGIIASFVDTTADYIGMFEGATAILDPDEELPLDNIKPESTYEDAVGPHVGRMWWCRDTATGGKGRVYFSPVGRAEAVAGFIDISGEEDETQKLALFNQQLYCLTKLHIYRIDGTDQPFTFTEVWGAPGTSNPHSVAVTPGGIMYFAMDGVRIFDGQFSRIVGDGDPLAPIFRGGTTDGLEDFNGLFGLYGRNEYYISDTTVVSGEPLKTTLVVNDRGAWREWGFPATLLFYDVKDNKLFAKPQISTIGAVWHSVIGDAGGSYTVSTAAPYLSIGTASSPMAGKALIGDTQFLTPRAVTVTAIYVRLPSTSLLTGTQTLTCRLNVGGVANSTITVSHSVATGALAFDTGNIQVPQDTLLCLEFGFGGGLTTKTINSVSIAYEITPE